MKTFKTIPALVLSLVLFLPLFALAAEESEKPDCPAYVTDVQGTAEVTTDEEEWTALEVNGCVYVGDVIRTGDESAVAMVLGAETLIRVNANSNFQLWNEDEDAEVPNELDMDLGEILTTIQPEEEGKEVPFKVNTPSGVVAVKGTEFFVGVDEDGKSDIKVLDGVVEAFNELGKVLVEVGMATELLGGVLPAEPFGFDIDKFNEYVGWANALKTGDFKKVIKDVIKNEAKKKLGGFGKF